MKPISFVQFLRPNGRQRPVIIDRPDDVADKAAAMRAAGWRFEIEELLDGTVSMSIEEEDVDDHGPIAMELVPNGPDVPAAVDALITRAYQRLDTKNATVRSSR